MRIGQNIKPVQSTQLPHIAVADRPRATVIPEIRVPAKKAALAVFAQNYSPAIHQVDVLTLQAPSTSAAAFSSIPGEVREVAVYRSAKKLAVHLLSPCVVVPVLSVLLVGGGVAGGAAAAGAAWSGEVIEGLMFTACFILPMLLLPLTFSLTILGVYHVLKTHQR